MKYENMERPIFNIGVCLVPLAFFLIAPIAKTLDPQRVTGIRLAPLKPHLTDHLLAELMASKSEWANTH